MRGLILDYAGVLDGAEDEQRRWRELIAAVRDNGVPPAISSNDPGGPKAQPIKRWADNGWVDKVLLSGETGIDKPEPEAFSLAAETLDLRPEDCVLVDDSIVNVRAAVEHGLIGVMYQTFDRTSVEITSLFDIEGEF